MPRPPPSSRWGKGVWCHKSKSLGYSSRSVEWPIKLQSSVYWNNVEVRTGTSIIPLKACYEIHYPTLYFYTNKASTLPQPQGFRLVTPDPFLVRGLGVATRLSRFVLYRNIMGVAPSCCYKLLTLFSPLLNKENRHASALVLINSILEYCPHYSMYTVEYEDCFKLCALFLLAERGTKSETRAGR